MARFVLVGRKSTRTSSPRATNCRATWLPRNPEAPVTSVIMTLRRSLHMRRFRYFQPRHRMQPPLGPQAEKTRAAAKTAAIGGCVLERALHGGAFAMGRFPSAATLVAENHSPA